MIIWEIGLWRFVVVHGLTQWLGFLDVRMCLSYCCDRRVDDRRMYRRIYRLVSGIVSFVGISVIKLNVLISLVVRVALLCVSSFWFCHWCCTTDQSASYYWLILVLFIIAKFASFKILIHFLSILLIPYQ